MTLKTGVGGSAPFTAVHKACCHCGVGHKTESLVFTACICVKYMLAFASLPKYP